jgi:flagellar motor switch protein FliM
MDALSQFDIDRLLGGGRAAAPAGALTASPPSGDGEADAQPYDFRRPHRVSKERLRTLEAMYERLVKSLEAWLVSRARGHVEMRLQSVEQFAFGEFAMSLPSPCASYVISVNGPGSGTQGVVDVGHEFAYFLVDRLFGGSGQASVPGRTLSPVERLAVRTVAERAAQLLEEIWGDHVPLELAVTGFESSPEILQVANREDPVLVANVEVAAGGSSSLLLLCLPFAVLEKFFQGGPQRRLGGPPAPAAETDAQRARTELALRATPLAVSARLPAFPLSLRDLNGLAVGQVLDTGILRDAELTGARGRPGALHRLGRPRGPAARRAPARPARRRPRRRRITTSPAMNPAEIDALVASVQAAKASGQPVPVAAPDEPDPSEYGLGSDFGAPYGAGAAAPAARGGAPATEMPLGLLMDLTLPVSIELGRTTMTVQEILRLGRGAVIQLDRLAGEPIDIYVGDRRFAEGEVVVLGEHFGVRIVRIFAGAPAAAAA